MCKKTSSVLSATFKPLSRDLLNILRHSFNMACVTIGSWAVDGELFEQPAALHVALHSLNYFCFDGIEFLFVKWSTISLKENWMGLLEYGIHNDVLPQWRTYILATDVSDFQIYHLSPPLAILVEYNDIENRVLFENEKWGVSTKLV